MERIDITKQVFKHHNMDVNSAQFRAFWEFGYSFVKIEDTDYSFKDLCGDTYSPEVNTDIDPSQLKRELRVFKSRVKSEGVYWCGLALNGELIHDYMVWGFVGDDYLGSGHDSEALTFLSNVASPTFVNDAITSTKTNIVLSLREIIEKAKLLDCVDTLDLGAIRSELLTDILTYTACTYDDSLGAFSNYMLDTHKRYLTEMGAWGREHQ